MATNFIPWNAEQFFTNAAIRLLVNADTLERLKRGESATDILRSWEAQLEDFKRRRAGVLIYN